MKSHLAHVACHVDHDAFYHAYTPFACRRIMQHMVVHHSILFLFHFADSFYMSFMAWLASLHTVRHQYFIPTIHTASISASAIDALVLGYSFTAI